MQIWNGGLCIKNNTLSLDKCVALSAKCDHSVALLLECEKCKAALAPEGVFPDTLFRTLSVLLSGDPGFTLKGK